MLTCLSPHGGPHPGLRQPVPCALLTGMANASLVAVALWLVILNGLGVI